MKHQKLFLAVCLIIFNFSAVFAQTDAAQLNGFVGVNDQPVANVTVTLTSKIGKILTAQTDAAGNFKFENLADGDYILKAVKPSSVTDAQTAPEVSQSISVLNGQSLTIDLDFYLPLIATRVSPSSLIRAEVVVIGSGTAQPIDEVSKSVSVVTGEELVNRNEISIIDGLRTVPGLRIQQSGGFGRLATIKTRGLRNSDTAILIDGQRFRDAAAITGDASPFLSDLQVTNVGELEILRGSGSSLYGTNAIGGVINITSNDFTKDFRGNVLTEGGGLGLFRGRTFLSAGLSDKAFVNFGLAHTNFNKGVDGDDAARNTSGKVGFFYNFSEKARLTSRFYATDAFVQLNSSADIIGTLPATGIVNARPLSRAELRRYENGTPINQLNVGNATFIPDANDPDNRQASRFYNFSLGLDGNLTDFANYRVSYQNLNTRRRNINSPAGRNFQPFGATSRNDNVGNIQTLYAKSDVAFQSNLLTFGYEFEREAFDNNNFRYAGIVNFDAAPQDFTDVDQTSNAIFVQNQLEAFNQKLQLSGGVRAQFFKIKSPNFSANSAYRGIALDSPPTAFTADGSAAYFFRATGTKLRAHVGNGYRVPSLYERFGSSFSSFSNSFTPFGDPQIEPERSIAFDGGVDQNFAGARLRLSATYFYTRLLETIGFISPASRINGSIRPFGGYANTRGGIARGGEFSGDYRPFADTTVFASYTYTKAQNRLPQNGQLRTFGVPDHQFTTVVTQRIADRLTVAFDFSATSSYITPIFQSYGSFATRVYRFDGNRKGDLTAAYEFPLGSDRYRLRLFGTAENIFNQDYYENGFRTPRATGRGGLQFSF